VGQYILRRIIQMIPVVLLVVVTVFIVMHMLPGDPILALTGSSSEGLSPEVIAEMRQQLGLDDPIYVQFGHWFAGILQGNFGKSTRLNIPVSEIVLDRIPVTLQLSGFGFIIGAIIGVGAGIIAAIRRNTWADIIVTLVSMMGIAMPSFWLAILGIWLFAVSLGWLPSSGYVSILSDPVQGIRYMILPAITLGLSLSASVMRQTRSSLLEVLNQDYVRTARAKGLAELKVIGWHALKNALLPVVTVMGLQLGRLLGGTVITETMFSIPGLGRLAVQSIMMRDYPSLQAVVLLMAVAVLVINLLTDLFYTYLDPRVSYR